MAGSLPLMRYILALCFVGIVGKAEVVLLSRFVAVRSSEVLTVYFKCMFSVC